MTRNRDPETLCTGMLDGDRIALARLITLVENRTAASAQLMSRVYPNCGKANVIGITGPPGAGKSTITSCLIEHLREKGKAVGVVAIDPSSPFSGGSVLGDRIRMQKHFLDEGVFIRSLSTRGSHGGLARSARDVARLLDAFGKDVVIIETVGVGQTELDIMEVADTVVVTLVPEAGDTVQVMKAGLLEIADVFVVNKADRDGAVRMRTELEMMLSLKAEERHAGWRVPVLMTQASQAVGTPELLEACLNHGEHIAEVGLSESRRARLAAEVFEICEEEVMRRLRGTSAGGPLDGLVAEVKDGSRDPYEAALSVLDDPERLAGLLQGR